MTTSHGDLTLDVTDDSHCTFCDSVSRTDSSISNSLPRHRVQTGRPWPPRYGPRAVGAGPSSREPGASSSPHVVSCHAAVATGSVYYDVARSPDHDTERPPALYNRINGGTQPCLSVGSTAAIVQPYCYLDDNIGAPDRAVLPAARSSQQQRDLRTSALSPPRPCTSTSTRLQYDTQTLDSHNRTGLKTKKTRHVSAEFGGMKSTRRKYLSKSCPNIRLVSMVDCHPQRLEVMSTFGKCRPAVQYDCITEDCCNVDDQKIFGFENSVYLGGREVDLFNRVDAVRSVSEAAARRNIPNDRTRMPSHQAYQSKYGTLHDTTGNSSRAARMRAFLSTDCSSKEESVVCEKTRLNSAVCKPIITTRHHKVQHSTISFLLL